ncbi:formylglycine-generating enzyme family protein [Chloroflexi bacterium TSY]|nr:formylglycine-generating enzyme family protein [Chloroflexi bacterium TSY]
MQQSWQNLQKELEDKQTVAHRRLQIGEHLAKMGDPRPGVGVKDGVPDIVWLPVSPGGNVTITRCWRPDTPEGEAKIMYRQDFQVEPFYIAKYLVTCAQYQAFVEADDGFEQLVWWQGMPKAHQCQKLNQQYTNLPNNPRDGLSWYQSVAFARWMNHRLQGIELPHPSGKDLLRVGENAEIRLPTEWEWQWAAQNGSNANIYPWGATNRGYANTVESGLNQAIAVGMYPHGAAACGALDMAGNLMEWCANDKANLEIIDVRSSASKALRGGDWGYGLENATCSYCDDDVPDRIDILNGCRLVLVSKK